MLKRYRDWAPTAHDVKGLGLPDRQDWFVAPCLICPNVATALDRANWDELLAILDAGAIGGAGPIGYEIHDFAHWATPYRMILVDPSHPDAESTLSCAVAFLEDSPILSDERFYEYEMADAAEYWRSASLRERVRLCKRYGASIFAARRDELPRFSNDDAIAHLAGG